MSAPSGDSWRNAVPKKIAKETWMTGKFTGKKPWWLQLSIFKSYVQFEIEMFKQ